MLLQVCIEIGGSAEKRPHHKKWEARVKSLLGIKNQRTHTHTHFLMWNVRDRHQPDLHLVDMRE